MGMGQLNQPNIDPTLVPEPVSPVSSLSGPGSGSATVSPPIISDNQELGILKKRSFLLPIIIGTLILLGIAGMSGYILWKSFGKSPHKNVPDITTDVNSGTSQNQPLNSSSMSSKQDSATGETDNIDWSVPVQQYRDTKLTIIEVNQKSVKLGPRLGIMPTPDDKIFVHTEVYKGIPIKWTANAPIPSDRLAWIKKSLDIAPDYLIKNYPVNEIISANNADLGLPADTLNGPESPNTLAFASGTNIYIAKRFLQNKNMVTQADVDEKTAIQTMLHEWTHVVQYYEGVRTFTDRYIMYEIGGLRDMLNKAPFVYDWGKNVGWYFKENWVTPSLKEDADSQKTTQYGTMMMYEDMAETFSHVMMCDTEEFSQTRIKGAEQIIGRSASSFCPFPK